MFLVGSVRNTLYAVVLVALLPALGGILYSGLDAREQSMLAARERLLEATHGIARQRDLTIESTRVLLATAPQFDRSHNFDQVGTLARLRDLVQQHPFYSNLMIADTEGTVRDRKSVV